MADSLAQLVEHNTFNVGVMGSSPMRVTKKRSGFNHSFFFSHLQIHIPPKVKVEIP